MKQIPTYTKVVEGKEEAKSEARLLLLQNYPPTGDFTLITGNTTSQEDGEEIAFSLTLVPSHVEAEITEKERIRNYPTALVQRINDSDRYRVYVYTYDRLPFYAKQLVEPLYVLPVLAPALKPEAPLPVEAVHTAQGRELLDARYGATEDNIAEELITTDKDYRIYTLFDSMGGTIEEVKAELDRGIFDGGVTDVERAINTEGNIYTTEKEHLTRLTTLCGATAVKKYKKEIVHSYRFYKALYFVEYLEYMLRLTEDYGAIAEKLPALQAEYGLTANEWEELTEENVTPAEAALSRYLTPYYSSMSLFEGLTYKRVAEYLNAPVELIQRLNVDNIYKNLQLRW